MEYFYFYSDSQLNEVVFCIILKIIFKVFKNDLAILNLNVNLYIKCINFLLDYEGLNQYLFRNLRNLLLKENIEHKLIEANSPYILEDFKLLYEKLIRNTIEHFEIIYDSNIIFDLLLIYFSLISYLDEEYFFLNDFKKYFLKIKNKQNIKYYNFLLLKSLIFNDFRKELERFSQLFKPISEFLINNETKFGNISKFFIIEKEHLEELNYFLFKDDLIQLSPNMFVIINFSIQIFEFFNQVKNKEIPKRYQNINYFSLLMKELILYENHELEVEYNNLNPYQYYGKKLFYKYYKTFLNIRNNLAHAFTKKDVIDCIGKIVPFQYIEFNNFEIYWEIQLMLIMFLYLKFFRELNKYIENYI
ncbi:MAG: hypothetical protein ACP6IY_15050 [Promethearchaeia archaeon]